MNYYSKFTQEVVDCIKTYGEKRVVVLENLTESTLGYVLGRAYYGKNVLLNITGQSVASMLPQVKTYLHDFLKRSAKQFIVEVFIRIVTEDGEEAEVADKLSFIHNNVFMASTLLSGKYYYNLWKNSSRQQILCESENLAFSPSVIGDNGSKVYADDLAVFYFGSKRHILEEIQKEYREKDFYIGLYPVEGISPLPKEFIIEITTYIGRACIFSKRDNNFAQKIQNVIISEECFDYLEAPPEILEENGLKKYIDNLLM